MKSSDGHTLVTNQPLTFSLFALLFQPLLEGWFLALYNVFYTSCPVLCMGLFEQVNHHPHLGLKKRICNMPVSFSKIVTVLSLI